MVWLWKVCVSVLVGGAFAQGPAVPLSVTDLKALQNKPCVFIHPWANWCPQCVVEMPALLPFLETLPKAQVVVVDVSTALGQKVFSSQWKLLLDAKLPTYLKPASISDKAYFKAVDPQWKGALPYSVLYSKGKRLKFWRGALDHNAVARDVAALCPL